MPFLSTLVAVLPLVVLGGVGGDIGYVGILQPAEGSSGQTLGRESQSRWLSTTNVVDAKGVPLGAFYPHQDGFTEGTEDDWDQEPTPTETASTQQLGTSGSEHVVKSHAKEHFATHDDAENVRDNGHAILGHMDVPTQHRQEQHRVPLQNMDNVQYFGDMMIGEPPQRMKVGDEHVPGNCCDYIKNDRVAWAGYDSTTILALTAKKTPCKVNCTTTDSTRELNHIL